MNTVLQKRIFYQETLREPNFDETAHSSRLLDKESTHQFFDQRAVSESALGSEPARHYSLAYYEEQQGV